MEVVLKESMLLVASEDQIFGQEKKHAYPLLIEMYSFTWSE